MANFDKPLGPTQAKIIGHWASLDAQGLHPDSKYLAARFGISKSRILGILRRLRDTGYVRTFGSRRKGDYVKSRRLTLTNKARELFEGESNE